MKLDGKIAIITGAASGIGRASALLFSKQGAKVVIGDVQDEGSHETVSLIKEAGGEAIFVHTDVTSVADLERMINATADAYGRIDILFNNAGIFGSGPLEHISEETFDRVVAVNLKAGVFASKLVAPRMKESGGGCIIFTSSGLGIRPFPQALMYSVTKAALIMLTKTLAVHLGKEGIRVNAVCPGPVETTGLFQQMVSDALGSQEAVMCIISKRPIPRSATEEEIAEAALFLASPGSSYITGIVLPVDGGGLAM